MSTEGVPLKIYNLSMASRVHSVAFESDKWTPTQAREWLKKNNYKPIKPMRRTKNTMRYRIVDPKEFGRFTTEKLNNGVNLVLGWPK